MHSHSIHCYLTPYFLVRFSWKSLFHHRLHPGDCHCHRTFQAHSLRKQERLHVCHNLDLNRSRCKYKTIPVTLFGKSCAEKTRSPMEQPFLAAAAVWMASTTVSIGELHLWTWHLLARERRGCLECILNASKIRATKVLVSSCYPTLHNAGSPEREVVSIAFHRIWAIVPKAFGHDFVLPISWFELQTRSGCRKDLPVSSSLALSFLRNCLALSWNNDFCP